MGPRLRGLACDLTPTLTQAITGAAIAAVKKQAAGRPKIGGDCFKATNGKMVSGTSMVGAHQSSCMRGASYHS